MNLKWFFKRQIYFENGEFLSIHPKLATTTVMVDFNFNHPLSTLMSNVWTNSASSIFGFSGPQNSFPFDSLHRKPRGMSFGMQHDVHHLWPPNGWMVVPLMIGWTAKNLPLGLAVYPTYFSGKIIDPFRWLIPTTHTHTHHCTRVQSWMKCCGFDVWDCQMVLDVSTVDGLEIMQKQLRPREDRIFP